MKYSVLLAALLAVSMTACSKKEESTTTITPAPDASMPAPDVNVTTPPAPDVNITTPPAPDVNITVPAPEPAPEPAPAPAP